MTFEWLRRSLRHAQRAQRAHTQQRAPEPAAMMMIMPVAGDDAMAAEFVPYQAALERLTWSETARVIQESRALLGLDAASTGNNES